MKYKKNKGWGIQIKGFAGYEFPIPTKIYDVEKRELIKEFPTRSAASDFSGVVIDRIADIVKNKRKCRKNNLGKIITFR